MGIRRWTWNFFYPHHQVQNLKREYERLAKRYSKHKREAERDREKSSMEQQDSQQEMARLNKKLEVRPSQVSDCFKHSMVKTDGDGQLLMLIYILQC